ncbi:MAG: PEGA domain-containing protein, partial [Nannocystaceae bacterium]|nr:PEGA domain-containing protein [Nannocystaceae bacterium]
SSEWTKPVVRATLDAVAAMSSAAALVRPRRAPTREVARPPRAAAPDTSAELEVDPRLAPRPRPRPRPVSAVQPAGSVPPVRVPRPTPMPRPASATPPESDESAAATRPAGARAAHTEPAGERASVVDTVDGGPAATELGAPIATLDAGTGALRADGTSGPLRAPLPVRRRYLVVVGALALLVGGMSAWIVFGPSSTATTTNPGTTAQASAAATAATPTPRSGDTPPAAPQRGVDAPESTSPPAPVATVGVVEVRAVDGAQVEIDGAVAGTAPYTAQLNPGSHTVKITAPGYAAWEETIEVGVGDNPMIDAKLKPAGKRKPGAPAKAESPGTTPPVEPDEPELPSEPLPDKPPPLQSDFPPPTTPKKPPPPPPPAPEPGSSPFLPTSPGAKDDGLMPN